MKLRRPYENDKGIIVHEVEVKGKVFKDVPQLSKCTNCSLYDYCEGQIRKFDCMKTSKILQKTLNIVSAIPVVLAVFAIYKHFNLGFFKGTAALLIFLVVYDAICAFGEVFVKRLRDNRLYRKLLKHQKREEKKQKEAELKAKEEADAQKALERLRVFKNDENYECLKRAEEAINVLKEISNTIDFGLNHSKIASCLMMLSEIVELLKTDISQYNKAAYLLEVYLPDFYDTLRIYSEITEEQMQDAEKQEVLSKFVKKFYNYLKEQKSEVKSNVNTQNESQSINEGVI